MKLPTPALVLLALLLTGCGDRAEDRAEPRSSSPSRQQLPAANPELRGLPAPPPGTGEGFHTDFAKAFTPGTRIDRADEVLTIDIVEAGRLQVGSGQLLVGDPGWVDGLQTVPLDLPQGKYKVQLSRVRGQDRRTGESGERIAAMRVVLGKGSARHWLYLASIGVDTGSAAFMTATAAEVLKQQQQQAAFRYEKRIQGDVAAEPEDTIDARLQASFSRDLLAPVLLQSHPRGPFNFVACSSGFGDGSYDVYVGLDAGGDLAEIVIDFGVLLEPVMDQVIIDDLDSLPPGPIDLGPLARLGITAEHGQHTESWLLVDATAVWGAAHVGGLTVRFETQDGTVVHANSSMQGGFHRFEAPPEQQVRVVLSVQVGVKPL